jgi:hypothetical protein
MIWTIKGTSQPSSQHPELHGTEDLRGPDWENKKVTSHGKRYDPYSPNKVVSPVNSIRYDLETFKRILTIQLLIQQLLY